MQKLPLTNSISQVMSLEDELERCTDIKSVSELTHSNSIRNFKTDFCRLKVKDCRSMLERHKLDCKRLWTTKVPEEYHFVKSNSYQVKTIWGWQYMKLNGRWDGQSMPMKSMLPPVKWWAMRWTMMTDPFHPSFWKNRKSNSIPLKETIWIFP